MDHIALLIRKALDQILDVDRTRRFEGLRVIQWATLIATIALNARTRPIASSSAGSAAGAAIQNARINLIMIFLRLPARCDKALRCG
jgi:hypothetical protein